MTSYISQRELAEMEARFRAMNGQSSTKRITYGEMIVMERRFREMERNSALRTFRAKQKKA